MSDISETLALALAEQLPTWILLAEKELEDSKELIRLNGSRVDWPWLDFDSIFDIRQDVRRRVLEGTLLSRGNDVAARFVVLSICDAYSEFELYDVPETEEVNEQIRSEFRADLRYFVRTLDIEQVQDWRHAAWELDNGRRISDWSFAESVWQRVESLEISEVELTRCRSIYRFMAVFQTGISSRLSLFADGKRNHADDLDRYLLKFDEEPYRDLATQYGNHWITAFALRLLWGMGIEEDFFTGPILIRWCCAETVTSKKLTAAEADLLKKLLNDVEFNLSDERSAPYNAMIGLAQFALGHFNRAAEAFEKLSRQSDPKFQSSFVAEARAHVAAGELGKAEAVLLECTRVIPDTNGVFEFLARIKTKQCQHEQAAIYFAAESEKHPEIGEDFLGSIVLALNAMQSPREIVRRMTEEFLGSEHAKTIENVIAQYWPTFELLSDESRENWIAGVMWGWDYKEPRLKRAFAEAAVQRLTKVVEVELRNALFVPFRTKLQKSGKILEGAGKLREYVYDNSHITLGEMTYVIKTCYSSPMPILSEFRKHLGQGTQKPPYLSDIEQIQTPRNSATHDSLDSSFCKVVHQRSVSALTQILKHRERSQLLGN